MKVFEEGGGVGNRFAFAASFVSKTSLRRRQRRLEGGTFFKKLLPPPAFSSIFSRHLLTQKGHDLFFLARDLDLRESEQVGDLLLSHIAVVS